MARKFKTLDVRPILARGVEPFSKIRESVDALRPNEGLSVIAPFLPSPLIEKLGSEGSDGFGLNQALLQARDGLFYGTAPEGGLLDFQSGDVFSLNTAGSLRVLQSFGPTNPTPGTIPNAKLIEARDGSIFGANGIGGSGGHGTIFRLNPKAKLLIAGVKVQPSVVHAGQSATGSVKLSKPAPNGGLIVSLRATSFQVTIPPTVTVPPGATTANFPIQTSTIGNNGDVRVYAAVNGQGIRTVFTIVP